MHIKQEQCANYKISFKGGVQFVYIAFVVVNTRDLVVKCKYTE